LNPSAVANKFQLSRHLPAQDLAYFVERYWIVSWNLGDQEQYLQETLPFPSVDLLLEPGKFREVGVTKSKFSVLLQDKGFVFGIFGRPRLVMVSVLIVYCIGCGRSGYGILPR
jgi:hypothetical protein